MAIGTSVNETTSLLVGGSRSILSDEAVIVTGTGLASRSTLSSGRSLFDADPDGRLDLLQAHGHSEDEITRSSPIGITRKLHGCLSKTGLILAFGLGSGELAGRLEVILPDGSARAPENVRPGQELGVVQAPSPAPPGS